MGKNGLAETHPAKRGIIAPVSLNPNSEVEHYPWNSLISQEKDGFKTATSEFGFSFIFSPAFRASHTWLAHKGSCKRSDRGGRNVSGCKACDRRSRFSAVFCNIRIETGELFQSILIQPAFSFRKKSISFDSQMPKETKLSLVSKQQRSDLI